MTMASVESIKDSQLLEEIVSGTKNNELNWVLTQSKSIENYSKQIKYNSCLECESNGIRVILTLEDNDTQNSSIFPSERRYCLTVFSENREVFSVKESNKYNMHHVCGSNGFGMSVNDYCIPCQESSKKSDYLLANLYSLAIKHASTSIKPEFKAEKVKVEVSIDSKQLLTDLIAKVTSISDDRDLESSFNNCKELVENTIITPELLYQALLNMAALNYAKTKSN